MWSIIENIKAKRNLPQYFFVILLMSAKLFDGVSIMGGRGGKIVGHHGWPTTKNFKITLAKMP